MPAGKSAKARKVVLPVAGLGTRFLPATKAQPKEMLPLVDKPLIQYGVEEALASGIEDVIIVTGRGKNAIEDHFDVSFELEQLLARKGKKKLLAEVRRISDLVHVTYVRQKKALGLGHAVLMAKNIVGDEPFAVLLGDDIIDSDIPCLKQMLRVYSRTQASVLAIMPVSRRSVSSYGIVKASRVRGSQFSGRLYRVEDMVEKPSIAKAPSNLAIVGRYILTPSIFRELEHTRAGAIGEIQLTDAIRKLMAREPVYAYRFEGQRHDAGDKLGFLKATVEFGLKRPDLKKPFRSFLKSLKL